MSKKLIGTLGLVLIAGLFVAPVMVSAWDISSKEPTDYKASEAMAILPRVIDWIFGFLIAIVTLMIIISGYMFVTGGGNPDTIGKARNMLMYALVGLAVAVLSKGLIAIVQMILKK
jgi:magnesium-transporting ATPase (P-type)